MVLSEPILLLYVNGKYRFLSFDTAEGLEGVQNDVETKTRSSKNYKSEPERQGANPGTCSKETRLNEYQIQYLRASLVVDDGLEDDLESAMYCILRRPLIRMRASTCVLGEVQHSGRDATASRLPS